MEPSGEKIRGETRCIGKPRDWDDQLDGPCGALSVRDEVELQSGVNFMHSEWVLQPGELALLQNHHGVVVLRISGAVHPVVSLHVEARPAPMLELTPAMAVPDGLTYKDGRWWFSCRVCHQPAEWPLQPQEFDPDSDVLLCGGSPRCCP